MRVGLCRTEVISQVSPGPFVYKVPEWSGEGGRRKEVGYRPVAGGYVDAFWRAVDLVAEDHADQHPDNCTDGERMSHIESMKKWVQPLSGSNVFVDGGQGEPHQTDVARSYQNDRFP